MQLRYNYRLDPTPGQRLALARAFGCARVVLNDALALREAARKAGEAFPTDAEVQRRVLTQAKRTEERAWLADVSSVVLVQAVNDLNQAYRNFFASITGKRRGPKIGAPRFRSRKDRREAIRFTRNGFTVRADGRLFLAKIGEVAVRWSRDLPSEPSSVTVVRDRSGRYFASFVVETDPVASLERFPTSDTEVGIDLGLASFAVLSDGTVIENPRLLRRAEKRLKKAHQTLSRKRKGSKNRAKAVLKVAKAHARVADARRDFQHQVSTRIVRENQAVYVEDLGVAGLGRSRLAKSVYGAAWTQFVYMLAYKASMYGRDFVKVDRFAPTSQLCSLCGASGGPKPLHVRAWTCAACGAAHDRDLNAAKNILALGRRERLNACGGRVRPGAIPAPTGEAGTRRDDRTRSSCPA